MKKVYRVVSTNQAGKSVPSYQFDDPYMNEVLVKEDRTAVVQNVKIQLYKVFNNGSEMGQPSAVIAAGIMDNSTQLLEAFTSIKE